MGRINGLVIGNILCGIIFIALSIHSDFAGDIYFGYVCFGLGIALLIWAIIKIAFNIGMKSSLCPKCGHKIARGEHWAFTHGLASRKARPCPGCLTVLIPSKWPFRIVNAYFLILSFAGVWLLTITDPGTPLYDYLVFAFMIVVTVSFEFGMATSRYDIVDEPKESS